MTPNSSSNNIDQLVKSAFNTLLNAYNHPKSKGFILQLLASFGSNRGIILHKAIERPGCCITYKKMIPAFMLDRVQSYRDKIEIAQFLTNTVPSNSENVLNFTKQFGWESNDTVYTTSLYKAVGTKKLLSKQAYIALQQLEQHIIAQEERAVETVNIFEVAEEQKKPAKKTSKVVKE